MSPILKSVCSLGMAIVITPCSTLFRLRTMIQQVRCCNVLRRRSTFGDDPSGQVSVEALRSSPIVLYENEALRFAIEVPELWPLAAEDDNAVQFVEIGGAGLLRIQREPILDGGELNPIEILDRSFQQDSANRWSPLSIPSKKAGSVRCQEPVSPSAGSRRIKIRLGYDTWSLPRGKATYSLSTSITTPMAMRSAVICLIGSSTASAHSIRQRRKSQASKMPTSHPRLRLTSPASFSSGEFSIPSSRMRLSQPAVFGLL